MSTFAENKEEASFIGSKVFLFEDCGDANARLNADINSVTPYELYYGCDTSLLTNFDPPITRVGANMSNITAAEVATLKPNLREMLTNSYLYNECLWIAAPVRAIVDTVAAAGDASNPNFFRLNLPQVAKMSPNCAYRASINISSALAGGGVGGAGNNPALLIRVAPGDPDLCYREGSNATTISTAQQIKLELGSFSAGASAAGDELCVNVELILVVTSSNATIGTGWQVVCTGIRMVKPAAFGHVFIADSVYAGPYP